MNDSSNIGQFVIHIGPPKTATTSLQVAFQSVRNKNFYYAGTNQPRTDNVHSPARILHDCVRQATNGNSADLNRALVELRTKYEQGAVIVISEEMFLVDQVGVPFHEKLNTLGRFLDKMPVRISLTIKNPLDRLPSYYQEVFRSLPISSKLSFRRFCRSHKAKCFDYAYVVAALRNAGFEDIWYIAPEVIGKPQISLFEVLGPTRVSDELMEVGVHNRGTVSARKGRAVTSVSIGDVGANPAVMRAISALHLKSLPGFRTGAKALRSLELRPGGTRDLVVPRDVANAFTASYDAILSEIRLRETSRANSTEAG